MNAAGCLFQFSSDKAQKVLLEDLRSFLRENETNKELLNYGK
jgi:phosphoesterase RecJ-like protein